MKIFLITMALGLCLLTSGCYTDSTKDSGAESSGQNEPTPRTRSRSY